jgi:uncharacterized DUF497 family protein
MDFEYDNRKSIANRLKHGIDFEQACALWNDEAAIELVARVSGELRWVVIGKISGRHWSAVITRRAGKVRIISVRRSRPDEVEIYEGQDL